MNTLGLGFLGDKLSELSINRGVRLSVVVKEERLVEQHKLRNEL